MQALRHTKRAHIPAQPSQQYSLSRASLCQAGIQCISLNHLREWLHEPELLTLSFRAQADRSRKAGREDKPRNPEDVGSKTCSVKAFSLHFMASRAGVSGEFRNVGLIQCFSICESPVPRFIGLVCLSAACCFRCLFLLLLNSLLPTLSLECTGG